MRSTPSAFERTITRMGYGCAFTEPPSETASAPPTFARRDRERPSGARPIVGRKDIAKTAWHLNAPHRDTSAAERRGLDA